MGVLEELRWFERHWQVRRKKLLPVVRLFPLYGPWRRVHDSECVFEADLEPKMTVTMSSYDVMII